MSSMELWESTPRDYHPQRLADITSLRTLPLPLPGENKLSLRGGQELFMVNNCTTAGEGLVIRPSCLPRSMRPSPLDFCLHCFWNQVELQELLKE